MSEFVKPPKSLLRTVGQTLVQYRMLNEGDRVLLGLSGGKDSLSLLHILEHFRRHAPVRFTLAAITIDPMSESFDPSPLKPYLAALGVPYFYESQPIVTLADRHMDNDSYCAFCSRMKRGLMYKVARENGFNVLALGQHLDDLAESFLMSAFHGGRLNTMKVHYLNDAGDVRIIRPLARVRERQTRDFAQAAGLPVIHENCPACFDSPTQRAHMKALLGAEEAGHPMLFKSLLSAMRPLMEAGLEAALAAGPREP
ncbi:MAG: ATP-binding protein [Halothiobacillaceae bacterium]|jgi:tRNA 2-thiocytidine biosynthesis protein TtcA|nr:ATP-binding protein [Halothiobacillaceae bacterium]MDY0049411.1 ATP-binding protein [Halothiobacillaceae bacterium]